MAVSTPPEGRAPNAGGPQKKQAPAEDTLAREKKALQGAWGTVEVQANGKKNVSAETKDMQIVFEADAIIFRSASGGKLAKGREFYKERMHQYKLDPGKSPKQLDVLAQSRARRMPPRRLPTSSGGRRSSASMRSSSGRGRPPSAAGSRACALPGAARRALRAPGGASAERPADRAAALAALWWAAGNAPDSIAGKQALAILENRAIAAADLDHVHAAIGSVLHRGCPTSRGSLPSRPSPTCKGVFSPKLTISQDFSALT